MLVTFAAVVLSGGFARAQSPRELAAARSLMVESEVAAAGIKDPAILAVMRSVPRHEFVPADVRPYAYLDMALPIGEHQTISPPFIVAYMTQQLGVRPTDRVLEIGTGSGYLTALLASRAAHVTTVEIDPALSASAAARLLQHGLTNIRRDVGDGARGWGNDLYDVIVLTGSTPLLPEKFLAQLKPNGRVFAIVGEAPVMTARLVTWTAPGARVTTDLFETVVAPLKNAATPSRFRF